MGVATRVDNGRRPHTHAASDRCSGCSTSDSTLNAKQRLLNVALDFDGFLRETVGDFALVTSGVSLSSERRHPERATPVVTVVVDASSVQTRRHRVGGVVGDVNVATVNDGRNGRSLICVNLPFKLAVAQLSTLGNHGAEDCRARVSNADEVAEVFPFVNLCGFE